MKMFKVSEERLKEIGADITTREILQQPELWQEVLDDFEGKREEVAAYLDKIVEKHGKVNVLFSGAGTSAYVGETAIPYLEKHSTDQFTFKNAPTTDVVSNPHSFLHQNEPTLLVSFARSGNSPESVATVQLADQLIDHIYHLTITCAPEGKLAQNAEGKDNNLLLLMPDRSNDQGFAMTGSFTCMLLTTLLVFEDRPYKEKLKFATLAIESVQAIEAMDDEIQAFVDQDFNRVIYLGSGSLYGIARESQLKILELTAGEIATQYESSLGFRHGPKSFVNEKTAIIAFVSNDGYTRQYDEDIIEELTADQIAQTVLEIRTISGDAKVAGHEILEFGDKFSELPDGYLTFPYVFIGQLISLEAAIKLGNKPDTPSPTGTVNRVVKGVTIHPLKS